MDIVVEAGSAGFAINSFGAGAEEEDPLYQS
jgi:hypothetical protein